MLQANCTKPPPQLCNTQSTGPLKLRSTTNHHPTSSNLPPHPRNHPRNHPKSSGKMKKKLVYGLELHHISSYHHFFFGKFQGFTEVSVRLQRLCCRLTLAIGLLHGSYGILGGLMAISRLKRVMNQEIWGNHEKSRDILKNLNLIWD